MRIHGICAYNGSNYGGWQKQPNVNTVQAEIEKVLSRILNTETSIQGSGRTDAGVHALNQHFHFEVKKEITDLAKFMYSVNCLLPEDIVIKSFEFVNDDWHSRFNAKKKKYIYKISKQTKDPFLTNLVWLNPEDIDASKLMDALSLFVGEKCFINFTSKEEDEDNFVRHINKIDVKSTSKTTEITFVGDGFMRYEIRFIVGTAVAYALGQIDLEYIKNHLNPGQNREIVRFKAPSEGLYLAQVFYK